MAKEKKKTMPPMSEANKALIFRIAKEHSHKVFAYLQESDIENEIILICLEAYPHYNEQYGPLENFLRKTVKNRLINCFKSTTKSIRSPCPRCKFFDVSKPSNCAKFGDNRYRCNKWRNYQLSISSRNSLLNASEDQVERFHNDDASNKVMLKEIKDIIRKNIDPELIPLFDKFVSKETIPKQKMKKLKVAIDKVLVENNLYDIEN